MVNRSYYMINILLDLMLLSNSKSIHHLVAGFRLVRFRSPLLTESLLFSLPPGTEMFHFPGLAPSTITVLDDWILIQTGSPIRISTDLRSLAANRSFSQLDTSFFAGHRQGIPHLPLVA